MNLYTIDLNLLVVFDALMTERSVTAAAAKVGLSQPAMSNALSRLRVVFDDALLVRTSIGMVPTPRAHELIGPVRQALQHIQDALQPQAPFVPAQAQQTFTLAATDYAELVLLPYLMQYLATAAPGVNINVIPIGPTFPKVGLENGSIDLLLGPFPDVASGLHTQKLFDERFMCLVRADHPHVGDTLSLKQFLTLSHVLVSARGPEPGRVDRALAAQGLQRRVALWVPHFLIIPLVVSQTNLIATLSERVVHFFASLLSLRVLPPPVRLAGYSMHLVWHERLNGDAAAQWLRGVIEELSRREGLQQPEQLLQDVSTSRFQ